jgi:hypothetical protein
MFNLQIKPLQLKTYRNVSQHNSEPYTLIVDQNFVVEMAIVPLKFWVYRKKIDINWFLAVINAFSIS